jgi:hypothetical protein
MAKRFGWMGPSGWLLARSQICAVYPPSQIEIAAPENNGTSKCELLGLVHDSVDHRLRHAQENLQWISFASTSHNAGDSQSSPV